MDFEKLCMLFTMQEPYYGIILSSMNRYPVKKLDTIGVRKTGNVFELGYNPDFMEKLSLNCALTVLKHEVLHLALGQMTFWEDENVSEEEHYIRNAAMDMEVNSLLDVSALAEINPVLPSKFGWEKSAGTREYYKRLKALVDQQRQQAQQPQQPCNGGQGGNQPQQTPNQGQTQNKKQKQNNDQQEENQSQGENPQEQGNDPGQNGGGSGAPKPVEDIIPEGFDDHSQWPKTTPEEAEAIQQQIDSMLVFAAEEVEKKCGTIPGELRMKIEALRKKPKPVADWKRFFRRYLGNEFSELIRKSRKRQSRRFPDAAGNRHQRKSNILVAIDTSGSVSMPEYQEFFGQISTLRQTADFHVVECDTMIQYEYDYNGRPNMQLHGGGGTSFQPVMDYFIANRRKYEALVYFTDGYCDIPKNTQKDTLWVISSSGDQSDRSKYRVNGASVVFIPKRNEK